MRKLIFYSLFITAIVFSGLFLPAVSFATMTSAPKIDYVPLAPFDVRGSEFTSGTSCVAPTCFPAYLRTMYNVGVALAGFFVVFSIVRGGFELLFTDSILGHSEGKGIILRALGGAVIVYASYIFMNQISPSLGRDLDLSLAFERVPKAQTGGSLTVVGNDAAKVAAFKTATDGIIANSRSAAERAANEEKARDAILDAPNIKALIDKENQASVIEAEGGEVPDELKLTPDEQRTVAVARAEAEKHQKIADNTRKYNSAIHTIGQQLTNANLLIGGSWIKPGAANSGDEEGNARLLHEQVQRNIDEMKQTGGDVVTAEIKDRKLVVDPLKTAAPLDPELTRLITSANDAVSQLCNAQYKTTPSATAISTVRSGALGMSDAATNRAVGGRDKCIANNTVKK